MNTKVGDKGHPLLEALKHNVGATDPPSEDSTYTPGYYAVFFDAPFTAIHFELSYTPLPPSPASYLRWIKALKAIWVKQPEWDTPPWKKACANCQPIVIKSNIALQLTASCCALRNMLQ